MEKRGATVEMVAMEGMIAMEMITIEMSPVEVTTVKMTTVEVIATAMIMMAVRGDAAPIARGTVNMTATTALVGIAAGAAVAVAVMARVIMENTGTNTGIVMGAEALAVVMVTVVVVVAGVGMAMGLQTNAVNPANNTLLILASKSSLIPTQPLELSQHTVTSAFIYRVQIIQIQSAQLLLISKVLKQNIKNWRVAQDLCTALDMRFRRIDKRVSLNTGIFDSSKLVDNTVVY
ncbi:uncharacterized protein LOC102208071 [Pundamilia nyererei]|uniref:Uncharacterized protein LOC102208071 n=1 Tax=Pundamilia nyererei TaxID=303518 RepID=A0A9Y3RAN0_9CICH|nr:PREDICTED: uncharacterized protein LOC102208071 [Pundamilia nyererei]